MRRRELLAAGIAGLGAGTLAGCVAVPAKPGRRKPSMRIAVVDAGLVGRDDGEIARRLAVDFDPQARTVARALQSVRPDVALLAGFDWDSDAHAARRFMERYLSQADPDREPLALPFFFAAPVNRGIPTPDDLDADGRTGGPGDTWRWGRFPGQQAMLLLSRLAIDESAVRTFQRATVAGKPGRGRIATTSIWDLPIAVGDTTIRLVAADTRALADEPRTASMRRQREAERRFIIDYAGAIPAPRVADDRELVAAIDVEAVVVTATLSDPDQSPAWAAAIATAPRFTRTRGARLRLAERMAASETALLAATSAIDVENRGSHIEAAPREDAQSTAAHERPIPVSVIWLDVAGPR